MLLKGNTYKKDNISEKHMYTVVVLELQPVNHLFTPPTERGNSYVYTATV